MPCHPYGHWTRLRQIVGIFFAKMTGKKLHWSHTLTPRKYVAENCTYLFREEKGEKKSFVADFYSKCGMNHATKRTYPESLALYGSLQKERISSLNSKGFCGCSVWIWATWHFYAVKKGLDVALFSFNQPDWGEQTKVELKLEISTTVTWQENQTGVLSLSGQNVCILQHECICGARDLHLNHCARQKKAGLTRHSTHSGFVLGCHSLALSGNSGICDCDRFRPGDCRPWEQCTPELRVSTSLLENQTSGPTCSPQSATHSAKSKWNSGSFVHCFLPVSTSLRRLFSQ